MFQPRPPIPFKPPVEKRKLPALNGVAQFVERFKTYDHPPPQVQETPQDKRRKRLVKVAKSNEERLKRQIAKWDPKNNPDATDKAMKTLFVGRLNYAITSEDLKAEFEYYGPVKKVILIKDKKGKSRGYAFVEFESSRDLKDAYKDADGRKIMNRRILVDVERGRTVKNWKPRRLGGGLGGTRLGGRDVNQKFSGREPPQGVSAPSGRRRSRSRSRGRKRKEPEGGREDRGRDRRGERRGGDRDRDRRSDRRGDRDRDRDRDRRRR